jgi:hypothetical protein
MLMRAVESACCVVTISTRNPDVISQRLQGAYFEGSEGTEGALDHQVHFSVSQLETGDITACKWEPELHEHQVRLSKLNFWIKSESDLSYHPPTA